MDHQAFPEHQAATASQETRAQSEPPEPQAAMGRRGNEDEMGGEVLMDPWDHPDSMDLLDPVESLEIP